MQKELAALAGRLISLNTSLIGARSDGERVAIERQIDAGRAQVDRLVYGLYGLSEEEIALIEA